MELSYFLAQLFGLTMMIFAGLAMFRPVLIAELVKDLRPYSFAMLMAGFFGIVGGLAVVLSHNIWEFSWVGLVTLFGWSALLKGVTYIAFPNLIIGAANKFWAQRKQQNLYLIAALIIGFYLAYSGFCIG